MGKLSATTQTSKFAGAMIAACIIMACLGTASATGEDGSDLEKLILAAEDTRMDSQDLAFFLATHDYDAAPKDGYVEVSLQGTIYKLIPNGDRPGLCDIALLELGENNKQEEMRSKI